MIEEKIYAIANPPLKKKMYKCHIIGMYGVALCGNKRVRSRGGISSATCHNCLRLVFDRLKPEEYNPGVVESAMQRAREMGVKV